MKQQWLIGTAFAVSMLFSAPVRAEENLISDREMDMVEAAPAGTYVYVPSNVRDIMLAVHGKVQDRSLDALWSALRGGAHIVQASVMPNGVAKAIDALKKNRKSYDAVECQAALDLLAAYQAELNSGDAVIVVEDATRSCSPKIIKRSLCVRGNIRACSLTVTGDATVGGNLTVTGNETIAGNETIEGNLIVEGFGSFADTLFVDGAAAFQSTLLVEGAVSFADTLWVDGNITSLGFILGSPTWAYEYTVAAGATLATGANAIFDVQGVSSDITATDTTTLTLTKGGIYHLSLHARGLNATAASSPIVLSMTSNNVAIAGGTASSNQTTTTTSTHVTINHDVIVSLPAGAQLRILNASADTLNFSAAANGAIAIAFSVTRLN